MFDKKQLEVELVLAGISRSNFAKELGMNTSTLYKKINNKTEWTLSEIHRTGEILGEDKIARIFFAKQVS